jgi:hypothetical protein
MNSTQFCKVIEDAAKQNEVKPSVAFDIICELLDPQESIGVYVEDGKGKKIMSFWDLVKLEAKEYK